ncbi:MAG: hypothetical protein V3T81_00990 [Thermoanaerobaculia bacterium]
MAAIALALAAVFPALAAAQVQCNSTVTLGSADPSDPMVGETRTLQITIQNGPSGGDSQTFDLLQFFPACTTTLPCVDDVDGGGNPPVLFVGNESDDCPGTITIDDSNPTLWDFNPTSLVLADTASCTVDFDVRFVSQSFDNTPNEIRSQVDLSGDCASELTSSNSGTISFMLAAVPTVGKVGLLVLALLLAVGSMVIFKRRLQRSS